MDKEEDQSKQIQDLLKFDGTPIQESDFVPDETPPEETPPAEETPPVEETPAEETPPAEPVTPVEPTESVEPKEPKEKTELETMKEKMDRLEEQNKAIITRLEADDTPLPVKPAAPAAEETPKPAEVKTSEFITEEEHTAMFNDRETMNTVLNRVYTAGQEAAMRSMPDLIRPEVKRQGDARKRVDAFFEDNPDLERVRKYMGKVVGVVVAEGITDTNDALAEAGKRVREELKIPKEEVVVPETEEPVKPVKAAANPAFAGAPGGGPPLTPVGERKLPADQAEVSDLIDFAKENA